MPKSKTSALLSLLLVFASGALVGAMAHRLYLVKTVESNSAGNVTPPPPRMSPEEARRRIMADYREKVKLDDQQLEQVDQIYDRTREEFDEIRKKFNSEGQRIWNRQTEELKTILRPDQVPLFEAYRAEREAKRKKPPGPPPC